MKQRVFIIHGWGGNPREGWFPWLAKELRYEGFGVEAIDMPDPKHPIVETWIERLAAHIGEPNEATYLVGHSVGATAIMRYLERLEEGKKIGGAVFVAPYFGDVHIETVREKEIADPWLTLLDFGRVKRAAKKFVAIFSVDDPYVSLGNQDIYRKNLGARIFVERRKGHFSGSDRVGEFPLARDAVLSFSKS